MAQAIKLKDAHKMMTEVQVDERRRVLKVKFADGAQGEVPLKDLKKHEKLDLERIELDSPYVLWIGVRGEEEPMGVPWDFVRMYCDSEYLEQVRQRQQRDCRTLAHNLKLLRTQRGWTQEELARRSGVSRVTISRIENEDEPFPRLETLEKLADALDISLAELFQDRS
jgi:DNA-binding XRE family transcriptional regulator